MKELAVFLLNKPGRLANVTEVLKEEHITIDAINLTEGGEFGIVRLIVSDPEEASELLRAKGYVVRLSDILAVEPKDQVGILNQIFDALGKNDINISNVYSTIRPLNELPTVILKTSDQKKAREIIEGLNITCLDFN